VYKKTPVETPLRLNWPEARGRCVALATSLLRCRHEAEDAVQEAFVRAWQHANSCREPENPLPWLMTITRRECLRLAQRRASRTEIKLEAATYREDDKSRTQTIDWIVDLQIVTETLSEEERTLLNLRYAEQLTQAEIAEVVDLPEGTVKTKLHRTRAKIRRRMGGKKI
jgi:RNA polymerase sigma-70 factor (ECF subfamily)